MKFRNEDADERPMPVRFRRPYADVVYDNCPLRVAQVVSVEEHYRPTISSALTDDRCFSLGLLPDDYECEHQIIGLDRFGYGRCLLCHGHFWCMAWVADGVFSEHTLAWAFNTLRSYEQRLPRFTLIHGGV